MALAYGAGLWRWPMALAYGAGLWRRPMAPANGAGVLHPAGSAGPPRWRGKSAGAGFRDGLAGHFPARKRSRLRRRGAGARRREVREASIVLLPCVPSSVAVARGRIAAELHEAGIFAAAVGDAVLVLSELLSNAVLHARPLVGAEVRVAWLLSPPTLEVIVRDGGSATRPRAGRPSLSAIGGRGLAIVEHLSSSWGIRADELGTEVWAVLPAPRAATMASTVAVGAGAASAMAGTVASVAGTMASAAGAASAVASTAAGAGSTVASTVVNVGGAADTPDDHPAAGA